MSTAALLSINDLEKSFGKKQVLGGFNLQLIAGQIFALVGRNGSGKSTVARVLAGEFGDYKGTISVGSSQVVLSCPQKAHAAGIGVARQKIVLLPNFSVADNLSLGTTVPLAGSKSQRTAVRETARKLIFHYSLPIDLDCKIEQLSAAGQEWIQIGRALLSGQRVVVFDGTDLRLGQGDQDRFDNLLNQLRREDRAVLYITHDLEAILRRVDQVVILTDGRASAATPVSQMTRESLALAIWGPETQHVHQRGEPLATNLEPIQLIDFGPRGGQAINLAIPRGSILGMVGPPQTRTALLAAIGGQFHSQGQVKIGAKQGKIKSRFQAAQLGIHYLEADNDRLGKLQQKSITRALLSSGEGDDSWFGQSFAKVLQGPGKSQMSVTEQLDSLIELEGTSPRLVILDRPTAGLDVVAKTVLYGKLETLRASGVTVFLASDSALELSEVTDQVLVLDGTDNPSWAAAAAVTEANLLGGDPTADPLK